MTKFFCNVLDLASLALLQCVWPCSFAFFALLPCCCVALLWRFALVTFIQTVTLYCAFFEWILHKWCAIIDLVVARTIWVCVWLCVLGALVLILVWLGCCLWLLPLLVVAFSGWPCVCVYDILFLLFFVAVFFLLFLCAISCCVCLCFPTLLVLFYVWFSCCLLLIC